MDIRLDADRHKPSRSVGLVRSSSGAHRVDDTAVAGYVSRAVTRAQAHNSVD